MLHRRGQWFRAAEENYYRRRRSNIMGTDEESSSKEESDSEQPQGITVEEIRRRVISRLTVILWR